MPACRRGLTDDGEYSCAEASEESPQERAVDGVIGFGKVDKAHEQRSVLLSRQFLQVSRHDHHVDRRVVGSKSTLLLRYDAFPLKVVTEAARYDFREYFAGVRHEGDATIITTPRPMPNLSSCVVT